MKKYIINKTTLFIFLNFAGIFVYLYVASESWNTSSALTYRYGFDYIFLRPFWNTFFAINGLWLILIIRDGLRFGKWISLIIWFLVGMLSYAAFQYDRYHFLNIVKETERYEKTH